MNNITEQIGNEEIKVYIFYIEGKIYFSHLETVKYPMAYTGKVEFKSVDSFSIKHLEELMKIIKKAKTEGVEETQKLFSNGEYITTK